MSELVHKIVAGIAEIAADDPTLIAAASAACGSGAELHLAHVYELPRLISMAPGLEMAFPEGTAAYEALLLEKLRAAAAGAGAGEAVCHVARGSPAQALVRLAAELEADLMIVGAARRARLGRPILGTTAQRVLRAAAVPVLVVRVPVLAPLGRVLLTTDLSELSGAVHEAALYTVEAYFGAPKQVRSLLVLGWSALPAPLTADAVMDAARGQLTAFLGARTLGKGTVQPLVRAGVAADEIVAEARDWGADLLVVGTHARGWGARLMLGSVAEASLRDAPCNVLAIPPRRVAALAGTRAPAWEESPELADWLAASAP
ncbi:MAG TPA: universal stress protein [Longimicrobium sp.]|nr:universal stress protein [Longimicrobium sp.]